jgi:hypothetical protein
MKSLTKMTKAGLITRIDELVKECDGSTERIVFLEDQRDRERRAHDREVSILRDKVRALENYLEIGSLIVAATKAGV